MATLTISAAETGFTTATKTYTMADATMDLMVQAYQQDANVAINGTATRNQVLNYITDTWAAQVKAKIQLFQTQPAVIPPPVSIA